MISVDTILVNEQDLAKLDDLCRLCGKLDETCIPIFDENNRYNYFKVINLHFKDAFEVSKSDALPLKLCAKCLASMLSWHEFYYNCVDVEKKFRQLAEKFNLDTTKKSVGNDVEVIEVSVDGESYDFFNENTSDFDISNVNIKETSTFADTSDLSPFDDDSDNSSVKTEKLTEKLPDHSELSALSTARLSPPQKSKKKKSTACRICGKLYSSRSTYLSHLQKAHTAHQSGVVKPPRKKTPRPKPKNAEATTSQDAATASTSTAPKKTADSTPTVCYICGKTFKHPSSFRNHMKYVHTSDPQISHKNHKSTRMCELCGEVCKGSYFTEHMMMHSDPDVNKCKECNKTFAYSSTLRSHMRVRHSDVKPFKCKVCSVTFKRGDYLRSHMRYKHHDVIDDFFLCEYCDNVYKTDKCYKAHIQWHKDNGTANTLNKKIPMKPRQPRVNEDPSVSYYCAECDLTFKKRNYYLLHKRYVHEHGKPYSISEQAEGQYKCDKCDRRFSSVSGRNYHCKRIHGTSFDMTFEEKCDHCGLTFRNRVFYARHRAKLNGSPTCYLCWQHFPSEEKLTEHVNTDHISDMPFVCELCKARFVALKNLNHHIRTKHLNDKPFKCDLCPHRATRKDSLAIHIRACHLGMKPYSCDTCGRKFSQMTDWRKHEVRHTRDKNIVTVARVVSVTESEAPKIKKDNSKSFTPGKRTTSVRGSAGTATKRSKSCATAVTAASGVSNPIKSEETTSNKPKANVLTITNQANKVKISSIKEVPSMMDQKPTNVPMDVLADIASGSEIKEEKINIEDDGDEIVQLECEVRLDLDMESDANELDVKDDVAESDANVAATSDDTKPKKKSSYRNPKMCDICGKVVNSKLFKEHMIGHSDPESMTCSCCGKLFSTISTLKKHFIWTHTSLRPFMCDLCGNTFKRNDHLKLHRDHFHANETSGGTALKCGLCGTSVQTMVSLLNHMKRVHNQTKVTSFDKDLNHKILADKSYECGICNMNFKQFSYLRIHIKFVHEKGLPWHINQGANGPYKCKPCNTSYATLQSLREHNRRRHDNAPVEKFHKECSHCGMLYRNRVHYSKHLAKISGRPTCYVCWNDFDNAEELKVHINTDHLDELPFGCELCGVRFVYLTELRNHMYTHSKTKQFKCDMCSQSFVRKDFLKSHMRRHLGIRNHTCEECSKSFVEFCDLRKHMQIHLKNRLFSAANR